MTVSENNLELAASLTDAQAERLWRQLEEERRSRSSLVFESVREAVSHLESPPTREGPGRRRSGKATGATKRRRTPL